jgi:spermidine/putrescine transport system substrate-binding protein
MYLYAISDVEPTRAGRYAERLNRRELLGAGAIALAAAACGGSTGGGGNAPSVASSSLTKKKIESTLNFYNWAQYHDPSNAKAFSQKYNVAFKESNYASNEELLTKLQTTKGQPVYDIIVPDADHVRIEKNLGLLMKLDHSLLPNLKNLAPHWRQLSYDPGNQYSVMKDTGLTGFTMRTDHVSANLQTWKDFFDFLPHAGGLNVNFIESPAEVIGVALNALGFSMNSESDAELNAARDLLLKVRPHVNTINEVYLDDFIAGKIDLGITYSGDGLRIRSARKAQNDILVVAPQGRSEIWIDNWAISAYAPDPIAAHAWINYMLEPAVNAREMEYVQYEVGTPASYPLVGAEAKDPLVVFPQRILNNYEILYTTPTGLNKRTAIWGEFKAG